MFTQDVNDLFLDGREFAVKMDVKWIARMPLVINGQCAAIMLEQGREFILTSPRQGDVLGKLFGAADHPWCQCR